MKVDITSLLIIFDELLTPPTNEELGVYWFEATRTDDLIVTLFFSVYELYVDILVHNRAHIAIAGIHMNKCSEIRVLDQKKKSLEIVHNYSSSRCFLQLTGDAILLYDE